MAFQTKFQRYELKYIITAQQKETLLKAMKPYMKPDRFGRTTVRNLYFDTNTYLLIRRSIEKPDYKEKLRVRSYGKANPDSAVFVELKKKYKSVVYKRRISLPYSQAIDWLLQKKRCTQKTQISDEIDYFLKHYQTLHPTVFLSYEREAFYAKDKSDLRITFDQNILVRQTDLCLQAEACGTPILPNNKIIMEIKCSGGIPVWMTETLSSEKIYKTSFSKYGTAYQRLIFPELRDLFTTHTIKENENV